MAPSQSYSSVATSGYASSSASAIPMECDAELNSINGRDDFRFADEPPLGGGNNKHKRWKAKPPRNSEMRKVLLLRMLREDKVGIAAVQEHHITSASILQSQKFWAERRGYGLAAVPTPVRMRGGVLLMLQSPTWKVTSVEYIGHRLILADLMHVTGDTVKVLAGHLHHDAPLRQKQWEQLGPKLTATSVPPSLYVITTRMYCRWQTTKDYEKAR